MLCIMFHHKKAHPAKLDGLKESCVEYYLRSSIRYFVPVFRFDFVKINPGSTSKRTPLNFIRAGLLLFPDQGRDFLTQHIEYPDGDLGGLGQSVADGRFWIEWIRIIVVQDVRFGRIRDAFGHGAGVGQ